MYHVPRRDAKNKSNYSAFPSTLLMNRNRSTQSPRCIFSSIVSGKQSLKPFSNNCFVHFPATMTKESSPNRPRRFAPLNPEKQIEGEDLGPRLKGIVFDVDGTLCECLLSSFYSVKCRPSSFWGYSTAFYLFRHIETHLLDFLWL